MSSTIPSASTNPAVPFDHPKADVILRSSDDVDFRVFKLFLSLASPSFEALFEISQSTRASEGRETEDGLVVMPMAEDGKTLNALLCFCYPDSLVSDPHLEAAKKFSLDVIEKRVRRMLSNPKILATEPLRCFTVVRRGQLWEETLLAAKCTLTQPLVPLWFKEIDLTTATDLLALLTYHRECGDAVCASKNDLS